ncbi:hypothetical protein CDAR_99131 [Caerostris darwini]|uniref:Uncharacterized protein n=1 Tax=Caerostris darwini TaxID=1538125 RepID=A0AAV4Q1E7_9ARAC|nr:hypothetical protein CDAR_99131 [Caerostris darwini]
MFCVLPMKITFSKRYFQRSSRSNKKEMPVARIGCSTWDPSAVSIWSRLILQGEEIAWGRLPQQIRMARRLMVGRFHFADDEVGKFSRKAPLYQDCLLLVPVDL